MSRDRQTRAAAVAILVASVAYWSVALYWNLRLRAFDPSDPSEQMFYAERSYQAGRVRGPLSWLSEVVSDPLAKPGTNAALSMARAFGAPSGHRGYKIATGVAVLLVLLLFQAAAYLIFGLEGLVAAAGAAIGSNIFLAQAYYGGHPWFGQVFLWLACLFAIESGWGALAGSPKGSFLFGASLGAAFLSSYHTAPLLAGAAACWAVAFARAPRMDWRAVAALVSGVVFPILALEGATFAVPKTHYWTILKAWTLKTARVPAEFQSGWGYAAEYFFSCESVLFAAALLALAAAGLRTVWKDRRLELETRLLLCAAPPFALLCLALPTVQLGRTYLPLLPFAFVLAGAGAAALLERAAPARWRLALAAACAAILFGLGLPRRRTTFDAFFAGPRIAGIIGNVPAGPGARAVPAGERLVVVGRSIPYMYLPDHDLRVQTMSHLRSAVGAGRAWVLVSPLSAWFWQGFMSPPEFDIPVKKVFASGGDYFELDGIESDPMERFTNEAIHAKTASGAIPFPARNRLYRAEEFLRLCDVK